MFDKKEYKPEDLFKNSEYQALANGTAELFNTVIPHHTTEDLRAYLEQDIFIFSQLKAHTQLTEARQYLKDEKGNIRSYHDFEQKIVKLNKQYNLNYLEAEYEFATHSAMSATNWTNLQEDTERYWLEYRTAGDDRVRVSHQQLNGICLPKDDPFWSEFYPPNGWRCRCVATEVLAKDKTKSDSKKAIELGRKATTHIGKNGKNKLAMFRFNPGQNKKVFPPNHSYKPKYCSNGKAHLNFESVFLSLEDERCRALKEIEKQARQNFETWEDVKTENGELKVSSKHGKNEKKENIEIASYFANKYGHKIRLLGRSDTEKTADTFNETLGIRQEYKRNKKPTINAIDREIRDAKNQADHIVLDIQSEITDGDLRKAIHSRVKRSKNIQTITIIRNNEDKTYKKEDIIKSNWDL